MNSELSHPFNGVEVSKAIKERKLLAPRFRTRSGLRPANLSHSAAHLFPAIEARHDHLKIWLRAKVELADPGQRQAVIDAIAAPTPDDLFRIDGGKGALRVAVPSDTWLVGGAAGECRWNAGSGNLVLDIPLHLNPQRFLAHQSETDFVTIAAMRPADALRYNATVAADIALHTLDGSDNVLLDVARLGSTVFDHRGTRQRRVLEIYLGHVKALAMAQLARSGCPVDIEFSGIAVAECGWELEHPNAHLFVDSLRNAVFASASEYVWRRKPVEAGRLVNADWVIVPRTVDIEIKVYAKTPTRVRVEVVYKQGATEETVRSGLPKASNTIDILVALQHCAAKRLHKFWSALMQTMTDKKGIDAAEALVTFHRSLSRHVPTDQQMLILSLLATGRGITQTPEGGFVPPKMCKAFVQDGILTPVKLRNRGGKRYALTRPFSVAFDLLLGRQDCPPQMVN